MTYITDWKHTKACGDLLHYLIFETAGDDVMLPDFTVNDPISVVISINGREADVPAFMRALEKAFDKEVEDASRRLFEEYRDRLVISVRDATEVVMADAGITSRDY